VPAVAAIKRVCARTGKPYAALRSASASAFLAGLARLATDAPPQPQTIPA